MSFLFLSTILFFSPTTLADQERWRFRAREHFEWHSYKTEATEWKFKGLSNTINFWLEKPRAWSIGLAAGPVIGSARGERETSDDSFGDRIRLWSLGLEAKHFPAPGQWFFYRAGISHHTLETRGALGVQSGVGGLLGIGIEFPVRGVGLAFELSGRLTTFGRDLSGFVINPALGVHFY